MASCSRTGASSSRWSCCSSPVAFAGSASTTAYARSSLRAVDGSPARAFAGSASTTAYARSSLRAVDGSPARRLGCGGQAAGEEPRLAALRTDLMLARDAAVVRAHVVHLHQVGLVRLSGQPSADVAGGQWGVDLVRFCAGGAVCAGDRSAARAHVVVLQHEGEPARTWMDVERGCWTPALVEPPASSRRPSRRGTPAASTRDHPNGGRRRES